MMKRGRERARDASVGIVVTLAAVIFATGIFSIGSEQRLWTRKVAYKLQLPNTNGLQVGSPVTLAGVQVGTVTGIELPADPNRLEIDVEFSVDSSVQARIRADSEATLRILSLLAGDKFVEITPGSPMQPLLPPGSYVRVPEALELDKLGELGAGIAEDLKDVMGSLGVILTQLQDPDSVIGQALFDPNFGRQSLFNIREIIESTKTVLEKVESGRGLAGRLLSDDEFAETVLARMEGAMTRMESLLDRLADEDGALMKISAPQGPLFGIIENMEKSASTLTGISEGLESGQGVAGRLLRDDQYAEEVLENLREVTRDLREVVGKLNSGEGAAGAFLNDPAIYEDLRDVLRGVKKSKMISWMIRHYRKKGEKARIKEEEERLKAMEEVGA
jgi:phospholipid/cholesterol/gamma-HCH transport system substrate-binding protein